MQFINWPLENRTQKSIVLMHPFAFFRFPVWIPNLVCFAEMDLVSLDVPFESERDAEIAFNSLSVDPEPKRSGLVKEFSLQGNVLHVDFK